MNVLGHPFVARKVFDNFGVDHLVGSWLPDLVLFSSESVFKHDEIHEGGEKFLDFLDENYHERRGLGLGMLAHGSHYGADGLSPWLEKEFQSSRRVVLQKIAVATPNLKGNEQVLNGRFHNFLWWGVDAQILRNETQFVNQLKLLVPSMGIDQVSELLAECFEKSVKDVEKVVHELLDVVTVERLSSVKGLAEIWQSWAKGLRDRDDVDVEKCVEVFEDCSKLVEKDWRDILEYVTIEVESNLKPFV